MVTFLHSGRDMSPFLQSGEDAASATFPGIFAVLATSLVIGEITASMGYNFKVGVPEAVVKRI
jgi:hypothetical protein